MENKVKCVLEVETGLQTRRFAVITAPEGAVLREYLFFAFRLSSAVTVL